MLGQHDGTVMTMRVRRPAREGDDIVVVIVVVVIVIVITVVTLAVAVAVAVAFGAPSKI